MKFAAVVLSCLTLLVSGKETADSSEVASIKKDIEQVEAGISALKDRILHDPNNQNHKSYLRHLAHFTTFQYFPHSMTMNFDHLSGVEAIDVLSCAKDCMPYNEVPEFADNRVPSIPRECPMGPGALCSSGDCKYRLGGTDWDWTGNCKVEGYNNLKRDRSPMNWKVLSQESQEACFDTVREMFADGIDINQRDKFFSTDYDKPPGCYVYCDKGTFRVGFNYNAWNYIVNWGYEPLTQPLCVKSEEF